MLSDFFRRQKKWKLCRWVSFLQDENHVVNVQFGHTFNHKIYRPLFSFGVCCLFIYTSTGSVVNQNCSYIQSPNFPSTFSSSDASSLTYTISKCSNGKKSISVLPTKFVRVFVRMCISSPTAEGYALSALI